MLHCTVVMPAYNTSEYIGQAIQSILSQTYPDYDILVIDDGSSDATVKVVQSFIPNNPISVIKLGSNNGVTYATKVGVDNAVGDIITVVDSDDKITADSLSTAMDYFNVDSKIGFLWTMFVLSSGRIGWSRPLPAGVSLWDALTNKWWNCSHQRFFRKSTYYKSPGFNTNIKASSDYQLALLLASTKCRTKHVNHITYWYRRTRNGNLSTNGQFQRQCVRDIISWAKGGFK